jgi:hypothetical protein
MDDERARDHSPGERCLIAAPEAIRALLASVQTSNGRAGVSPRAEAAMVVMAAARFAGWRYLITREQAPGLIDCSSLVSQSHWLGGAIGMPFTAEAQRTAYSGNGIGSDEMLPGDVLVRHPQLGSRPHNHVVMFLGRDNAARPWVLESRAVDGVRARLLIDSDIEGGIRRFCPHPLEEFDDAAALNVAADVPKLGRLGCRLTAAVDGVRRHSGTDVCPRARRVVVSPMAGTVTWRRLHPSPGLYEALVVDDSATEAALMRPIATAETIRHAVEQGDVLGETTSYVPSGCNTIPAVRERHRLHVELWSRRALPYHPARELPSPSSLFERATAPAAPWRSYGVAYALKLGVVVPFLR